MQNASERAYRLGCNTFQIFSSSPRQWAPARIPEAQSERMRALNAEYGLAPLVIHVNYLVNLAGAEFHGKSVRAFRGEMERALVLGAGYLVLHPGSFRGLRREQGIARVAAGIAEAADGLDLAGGGLKVAIENTAGSEFSLGGTFEQVAELMAALEGVVPVAACIDTCHTDVAGYDIVSAEGFEETLAQLEATVGLKNVAVWHCNAAKAVRGSHLDRHQHIGEGMIGVPAFRRLLNDPRLEHAAFIAETPIDEPGDDARNVETLKALVMAGKRRRDAGKRERGPV